MSEMAGLVKIRPQPDRYEGFKGPSMKPELKCSVADCSSPVIIGLTRLFPGTAAMLFPSPTVTKTRKSGHGYWICIQATNVEGSAWPTIRAGGNCSFMNLATAETTNPLKPPLPTHQPEGQKDKI